ncbi:hypothetical protein RND81_05G079700 [Saponaria officinalis]|uniref:Alpha/beta hydrolase fold-3 domain-containing protein n=1 Tax=Saponaria officinalis TaxID=3572 RepID=A0AAW1KVJ5_SAPOF
MSTNNQDPICTVDPYQYTQIKLNSDGTVTRSLQIPSIPATPDPASPSLVLSDDFPLNKTHKTFLRVFIPKMVMPSKDKLPIIVYCHGGGFVLSHVDSNFSHEFCEALASHVPAIVVSVEYRLAPEHRLPAAYEDVVHALQWIRDVSINQKCEWLSKNGDFDNCFLMGSSAGGNIAYHAAARAMDIVNDLHPLRLKGLILHQPFFGGSKRTGSEIRFINDPYLPLSGSDLFWELGLPVGADRDHEFCNPLVGDATGWFKRLKESGWRVLVTGCGGDPLIDRLIEFAARLSENGVSVKEYFTDGDHHGVELVGSDPSKQESLTVVVQEFVKSCMNA